MMTKTCQCLVIDIQLKTMLNLKNLMSRPDYHKNREKAKRVKITNIYSGELKSGRILVGKCPFHEDTGNPNFRLYTDTNSWYCFRCGEGGDVITFMMKLKSCNYVQAIRELLKYA